jgi:hypothetical protein
MRSLRFRNGQTAEEASSGACGEESRVLEAVPILQDGATKEVPLCPTCGQEFRNI